MFKVGFPSKIKKFLNIVPAAMLLFWQLATPVAALAETGQLTNNQNTQSNTVQTDITTCDDTTAALGQDGQLSPEWKNRCTGSVKVNKQVDLKGNGQYTGDNDDANKIGFRWGLDSQAPMRLMGSTAPEVKTGSHKITEKQIDGYAFTGWFANTAESQHSCKNPQSTEWPTISVLKEKTTEITLCNQALKGQITIIKDAKPNSTKDFHFKFTPEAAIDVPDNFILDDDQGVPGGNDLHGKSKTFSNLVTGKYEITEAATDNWNLKSIDCSDDSAANVSTNVTVEGRTVTINLEPGQHVTCTFTNQKEHEVEGTVTVHKQTVPAHDEEKFKITASGTGEIDGNVTRTISDGQSQTYSVSKGTYNVSEAANEGWHSDASQCQHLVINAENKHVECTIINTKLAELKIVKDAKPNSSQVFDFTTNFSITATGSKNFSLVDNGSGQGNSMEFSLMPGDYSVTEKSLENWNLKNIVCSDTEEWNVHKNTVRVSLHAGDEVVCKFTNVKEHEHEGVVKGVKFNDLNGDGQRQENEPLLSSWTIQLFTRSGDDGNHTLSLNVVKKDSVTPIASTQTDENGAYQFKNLKPGDYKVCEVQQDGWVQTAPSTNGGCHNFTIEKEGDDQVVGHKDFGNFQKGTVSGFKFNDGNGNGSFDNNEAKLSDWTITLNKSNGEGGWTTVTSTKTDAQGNYSFGNLLADQYQVCETAQAGWTRTFPTNSDCQQVQIDQSGQTVTALFGNKKNPTPPQVLSETTGGGGSAAKVAGLVNTGDSPLMALFASLAIIGMLGAATRAAYNKN